MQPYVRQILLSIWLGLGAIASGVGLIGSAAYILARAALHPSIADLQVAIVGVRFFGLARGLLRYLERLASHQAAFMLLARLRLTFYQALESLAPARLIYRRSGDLLGQIVSELNSLEGFYVRGFAPFLTAALSLLAGGIFFGVFSWKITLVMFLLLLAAVAGLPLLAFGLARVKGRKLVRWRARLNTALVDCLQGMPDLLVFDQALRYIRRANRSAACLGKLQRRDGALRAGLNALNSALAQFASWAVLLLAVHGSGLGQFEGVWIGALALMALSSFEAAQPLPQSAQRLSADAETARRLLDFIPFPSVSPKGAIPLESSRKADERDFLPLPKDFTLQVADLSFAYPAEPGSTGPAPWALRNISFTLPPGKRLAVVGPSGAGKTTLVNLLLRLWDFTEGSITLGGVDLRRLNPQALRQSIAVLPQDAYLFNASIRDNLRLAHSQATDEEMLSACRKALLADVIQSLPHGLDTWVGEGGARFSAGERQRLALARALLREAPLLILDEPTAHLDVLTQKALQSLLTGLGPLQASLVISHRLAGLESFDEILVLDGGRIVQRGTFDELMRQEGLFYCMWQLERDALSEPSEQQ